MSKTEADDEVLLRLLVHEQATLFLEIQDAITAGKIGDAEGLLRKAIFNSSQLALLEPTDPQEREYLNDLETLLSLAKAAARSMND